MIDVLDGNERLVEPATQQALADSRSNSTIQQPEDATDYEKRVEIPGHLVADLLHGKDVEGGERGTVQTHVVVHCVGLDGVVADIYVCR